MLTDSPSAYWRLDEGEPTFYPPIREMRIRDHYDAMTKGD